MSAQTRVELYKLDSKIGVSISDQISPLGKIGLEFVQKKRNQKKKTSL